MRADPVAEFITARLDEWEQVHVQPALVAALRAIHAAHPPTTRYNEHVCKTCRVLSWPCPTVRHLAATWSEHPDYQNRWKL